MAEWNREKHEKDSGIEALLASLEGGDPDDDLLPEDYQFVCSIAEVAKEHGFAGNSYSELFGFLQQCISERASDAGADARLTIKNAELAATKAELARLRLERESGVENVDALVVDVAWGGANTPRPDFLASFSFDSDGVIKAAEWVARSLRATLQKTPGDSSLYELAKEAADAQIISKDVYRLCETLRHQRNRFAHDRIGPVEARQHALLALTTFSLIYREVYPRLPSPPSME